MFTKHFKLGCGNDKLMLALQGWAQN